MEGSWERADVVEPLSPGEIAALLEGSGMTVVGGEPIREGLANANHRIEDADGGRWVLRRYRRDPDAMNLEVALLRGFAGAIPVPTVRHVGTGKGVVVLEMLPGRTLQAVLASGDAEEARSAARSIGEALANIASRRYEAGGFLDGDARLAERWPSVYDGLFGFLGHGLGQALARERAGITRLERVRHAWRGREDALRAATASACLSHGDYKPANLLIQDGSLTGVLDWEFAHAGTWLLDAGQLLRYLGPHRSWFAEAVRLGRLERGLPTPTDWEDLARLVDTASLVDFLGRPGTGDRQTRDVLALLDESLGLLERA